MTPLPSSGTLKFSDINVELARSSTATIALDQAENGAYGAINLCSVFKPSGSNPATVSEWYSYNHTATASIYLTNTEGPSGTSAGACLLADADQRTIYVVGSKYYSTSICTTFIQDGFHRNSTSTTWYEFFDGALINTGACAGTTTTTTTTVSCTCNRGGQCSAGCDCPYPLNDGCTTAANCSAPCF